MIFNRECTRINANQGEDFHSAPKSFTDEPESLMAIVCPSLLLAREWKLPVWAEPHSGALAGGSVFGVGQCRLSLALPRRNRGARPARDLCPPAPPGGL